MVSRLWTERKYLTWENADIGRGFALLRAFKMWKTGNFGVFSPRELQPMAFSEGEVRRIKSDVRKKLRNISVYETDYGDTALEGNYNERLFSS